MIQPQAFFISVFFTAGKSRYDDFDLCNMDNNEAALYFFIYWLIWPILILLYIPTAVTLSPIYLIGLTIKLFELFIEVAADGEEINERV